MPDFEGSEIIELQPLDVKIPYTFKIEYCTAASANDGVIPYGYTVTSIAATGIKYPSSLAATSELFSGSTSLSTSNSSYALFSIPMTWPTRSSASTSVLGAGTYHMRLKCKLSGGTTRYKELNFNRIFVRDK